MSVDDLLSLISSYLETRDRGLILGDEPLASAHRLVTAAHDGLVPVAVAVAQAVGLLRLCRYDAGGAELDLLAARSIFDALRESDPALVPSELIEQLTAEASDGDLLAVRGAELLAAAQADAGITLLDDAINMLCRAVEHTGTDDPDRAGRLSNLGLALRFRADRTGSGDDLTRDRHRSRSRSGNLAG